MTLFEEQNRMIQSRFPGVHKALPGPAARALDDFAIEPARKQGTAVHKRLPDGRIHRVHSMFDPASEAEKVIAHFDVQPGSLVIMQGLGLGYPLPALHALWGEKDITIVALEREAALFSLGMEQVDMRAALNNPRLILKCGDLTSFTEEETGALARFSHRHVIWINLPGPYQLNLEHYQEAANVLRGMIPQGNRVIVLGLDGAEPSIVEKLCGAGKLPTLAHIMKNGAFTRLRSTTPPHSGPAWAAFSTGCNPGKTGAYSFQRLAPGKYEQEPLFSRHVRAEKMWQAANRHGKTAGVLNVPLTQPPDPVDGFMVSGLPSHEKHCHPPDILAEFMEKIPDNVDGPAQVLDWDPYCMAIFIRDMNRSNTLDYASQQHPTDLQIAVFDLLDRVQHRYMHMTGPSQPFYNPEHASTLGDAVETAYGIMDTIVQKVLLKMAPGDTLFIVSDHGFRACPGVFHLTGFLHREGYLTLTGEHNPATALINKNEEVYQATDWSRTRAFVVNDDLMTSAGIRLNVRGREPGGIVEPGAEYESLRDELMGKLGEITHPESGRRIMENIYKREDVFSGPYADEAPDILLESAHRLAPGIAPGVVFSRIAPPGPKQQYLTFHFTGFHAQDGIFMALGKNIRTRAPLEKADMADVAPTILHALQCPVCEGLDGRVIPVFNDAFMRRCPVRSEPARGAAGAVPDASDEDKQQAMKHLEGMGYL